MSFIEERLDDLETKFNKLERVLSIISKNIIKEPVPHTQDCIDRCINDGIYHSKNYKSLNDYINIYYYSYCHCDSNDINAALGYQISDPVSKDNLKKIILENKKANKKKKKDKT